MKPHAWIRRKGKRSAECATCGAAWHPSTAGWPLCWNPQGFTLAALLLVLGGTQGRIDAA